MQFFDAFQLVDKVKYDATSAKTLSSGWDQLPGNQTILDAFFEFQEWGTSARTI